MTKNQIIAAGVLAVGALYLATKKESPWWSDLALSDEQRTMLWDQEREFWAEAQGNTGYPAEAMTGGA